MNTFKKGDWVKCINNSYGSYIDVCNTFVVEKCTPDLVYFTESITSHGKDFGYCTDRFELVKPTQTMNQPFVTAIPSSAAQPANNKFYAYIYLPVKTHRILEKYQGDSELAGEKLIYNWGDPTDDQNYRFRRMQQIFKTAQEALDAGEKALRDVFSPVPVTPVSTDTIRYVNL